MPCFHPLTMYRVLSGRSKDTGNWPLTLKRSEGYEDLSVQVPCGKCIGCRLDHAKMWTIRNVCESRQHDRSAVVTLTYDNSHLSDNEELVKSHLQDWFKRLRYYVGSFRYFGCGEYGTAGGRPHYHVILYGIDFADKVRQTSGYSAQYTSELLEKTWPFGFCTCGDFSIQSAAYISRYVLKKCGGDIKEDKKQQEFTVMSNRPGIGANYLDRYADDLLAVDRIVTLNDGSFGIPRYFVDRLQKTRPDEVELYKGRKEMYVKSKVILTPLRIKQQEEAVKLKLKEKKRNYESCEVVENDCTIPSCFEAN